MPDIYVDDEVYDWLLSRALTFEDTANSVLRRVAGLESDAGIDAPVRATNDLQKAASPRRRITAKSLARQWGIDIRQGRYHRDGHWYENLTGFPGALFDPDGYVVFETEEDYRNSPYLEIGVKTNVRGGVNGGGIKSMPGYFRCSTGRGL